MGYGNAPYTYQQYLANGMQGNGQFNQVQQNGNMFGGNQMQNYGQYNQTQFIKGRPVSGIEEARAAMIDLDGSIFVFPDVTNKRIFTKQILLDGSAEVKTYVLEEEQHTEEKEEKPRTRDNKKYVLKSEYDKALKNLNSQIEELMSMVGGMKDENESVTDV